MVNGNYVMTTFRLQGERKGKAVDLRGGHLMRLTPDGKVIEGWGFAGDQEALDDFFCLIGQSRRSRHSSSAAGKPGWHQLLAEAARPGARRAGEGQPARPRLAPALGQLHPGHAQLGVPAARRRVRRRDPDGFMPRDEIVPPSSGMWPATICRCVRRGRDRGRAAGRPARLPGCAQQGPTSRRKTW